MKWLPLVSFLSTYIFQKILTVGYRIKSCPAILPKLPPKRKPRSVFGNHPAIKWAWPSCREAGGYHPVKAPSLRYWAFFPFCYTLPGYINCEAQMFKRKHKGGQSYNAENPLACFMYHIFIMYNTLNLHDTATLLTMIHSPEFCFTKPT